MMSSFENVLRAVIGFLNDAQSLGIIKSFTLTENSDVNYSEISGVDELLSHFFKNINIPPISTKNSSSDDEYIVIDDEKKSDSESPGESPTKENSENQNQTSEVSPESCNSQVTEQVNEEEKMPESASISDTLEKTPIENSLEHPKNSEKKEEDSYEFPVKKNLVQINVDASEMKRRISAFICRKRKEVDEWNIQEFCGRSYIDEQDPAWENLDSCARVDAVFVPRRGCKSHIKVSRVQNVWGPQTQWHPEAKKIKQEPNETESQPNETTFQAVDERLLNMETHLKLKSDSSLRTNIFKRLRDLEDRILLLESSSPEYVHVLNPDSSPKRKKSSEEKIYSNCSVEDIQKRILTLKESLKAKSSHIKSELNFNV